MDAAAVRDLLRDPEAPFAVGSVRELSAGRDESQPRRVLLADLAMFARRRGYDEPGLEDQLDAIMGELGAERFTLLDPWSAPRRALRRIAGKQNSRSVVYELPPAFFGRP